MNILLIEDDPADIALVQKVLARRTDQPAVVVALHCNQALDAMAARSEANPFNCILVDHKLPGALGTDCILHIRETGFPGTIILLTGFPDARTAVVAMRNGADDFLSKSNVIDELNGAIDDAVARRAEAVQSDLDQRHKRQELDTLFDELQSISEKLKGRLLDKT